MNYYVWIKTLSDYNELGGKRIMELNTEHQDAFERGESRPRSLNF